jgi:hypothetical protein
MEEGHYKKQDNGAWIYADAYNIIINKDYVLSWETHQDASYPIDGWTWHESAPQEYVDWIEFLENENIDED